MVISKGIYATTNKNISIDIDTNISIDIDTNISIDIGKSTCMVIIFSLHTLHAHTHITHHT
jgi:hypothetical protein